MSIEDARAAWKAGRADEALRLVRESLAPRPDDAAAWVLLGRLVESSDPRAAFDAWKRAAALAPDDATPWFRAGLLHGKAGRPVEAAKAFRQAVQRDDSAVGWANLARALEEAGDVRGALDAAERAMAKAPDLPHAARVRGHALVALRRDREAVPLLRSVVASTPEDARSWADLGRACLRLGEVPSAVDALRRAVALKPSADILVRLGRALGRQGDVDGAAAVLRDAVERYPDHGQAWTALGALLGRSQRRLEAVDVFERMTRRLPGDATGWGNLSTAYLGAGRPVDAELAARKAIELAPGDADGWSRLGLALDAANRVPQACEALREAAARDPRSVVVRVDLARVLRHLARLTEAEAEARRAIALDPKCAEAYRELGMALKGAARPAEAAAAYAEALEIVPDDLATWSSRLLCLAYDDGTPASAILDVHREFGRRLCARVPRWPLRPRAGSGKVVAAFLSADFVRHPIGHFMYGVLPALDRSRIEVVCIHTGLGNDAFTAHFRQTADRWIDAVPMDDAALCRAIEDAGVDVLLDMLGHTGGNRLPVLAAKPAPVQVGMWGYVGSNGLPTMDWIVADRVHAPIGADHEYLEKIWRMPYGYAAWRPPADEAPPVNELPAGTSRPITFGSFNNAAKVTPTTIRTWAKVLQALPDARLVLRTHVLGEPETAASFRARFAEHGVADRVDMYGAMGFRALLAAYGEIDVGLDTFPHSGGVTTLEALWMGVPVVTRGDGDRFSSRHTKSHLTYTGLTELIAEDEDDFVRVVVELAQDRERLKEYRRTLRERLRTSPICDAVRYAASFSDALMVMAGRPSSSGVV